MLLAAIVPNCNQIYKINVVHFKIYLTLICINGNCHHQPLLCAL